MFVNMSDFGCVAKSIIRDINTLPIEGWSLEKERGIVGGQFYFFKHSDSSYKLMARLNSDGIVVYVSIIGVSGDPFTLDENRFLLQKLTQLLDRMLEFEKQKILINQKEELKKLFPDCFPAA